MKALVIYESFYGNTEKIALAIADALRGKAEVQAVRVGELRPAQLTGMGLLVVGSPTRAFSPCPDTKAWLKGLRPNSLKGVKVAAFDTRLPINEATPKLLKIMAKLFGNSAADPISARLTKAGGKLVASPGGFIVTGTEGPLADGELERATAWAKQILSAR